MADFLTSTHRAKWIFSPQQLVEKYRAANERAKQALEKCGATLMKVDVNGLSYPKSQITSKDSDERHSRIKPLSIEEEKCTRLFYEKKIQEVCKELGLPHKIQATAVFYFKRFYLQWSVMEHQPKHIMLSCIYAACKIEENYVSAEQLSNGVLQDHQTILDYEMIVYQSLEFNLIVYAPYRSVEGFINDMEEFCNCNAGDDHLEMLKTLQKEAISEVNKLMLTDAPLLFTPGQLALATLRNSNALSRVIDFDSYLRSICSRQNSMHSISELSESLNAIDSWMQDINIECPSKKVLKCLERKLMSCWGLRPDDESKKGEKKPKHKFKKSSNETSLPRMEFMHTS